MAVSSGRRGTKPYDEYEYYEDGLFNSWSEWIGSTSNSRYKKSWSTYEEWTKSNTSGIDIFKSNPAIFYIEYGFNKMV